MNLHDLECLKKIFSDLINYESSNPLDEIDPLTYELPEGDSCLHIGVGRGNIRAVKLLIEAGLDINKKGDMSLTPLHVAYRERQFEIAQLLIENGADVNAVDEFGRTPVHWTPTK